MVCMLPALDDQSEAITKKVEDILIKTEKIVGTKMFYGTIWMTLLRSSRTRIGGLKFIDKSIPKDLALAKKKKIFPVRMLMKCINKHLVIRSAHDSEVLAEEEERLERLDSLDYYYFYYPQKGKLVINSLMACMMDNSVYVNRMVIDFMNTHLGVQSGILKTEENSVLIETALHLITRKDFACLKKFSNWLFGYLEDEEEMPNLEAIIPALKNLFDYKNGKVIEEKKASLPITMIQTLLYENFSITGAIMDKVAVEVLDYVHEFIVGDSGRNFTKEQMKRFEEACNNFFEDIEMQLSSVLKALGRDLSEKMDKMSIEDAVHSLQRIGFALEILPISKVENINDLLKPMLSRILAGVQKLSMGMTKPENTIPALKL